MEQKLPRLVIAGTNSGCGKTTVTCAVLQALVNRGLSVAAAKCGPDYIDPMFHSRIIGAKSANLDPFFFDEPTSYLDIRYKLELLTILKRMVREEDLAVLMSLHELDLARRVSDTVVCVAGDHIDRVGPPEEIFTRDYIAKLYHMEPGKYDPCFATLDFVP